MNGETPYRVTKLILSSESAVDELSRIAGIYRNYKEKDSVGETT